MMSWSADCVIFEADRRTTFRITDQKTQDNTKSIQQIKYQSKLTTQVQNNYLAYLIDPSFQRVNTLFFFSFENKTDKRRRTTK